MQENESKIIIYQTEDGQTKINVAIDQDTVWLTQEQISVLFGKGRTTITEHIKNVFTEGELDENSVCRDFRLTANDKKIYSVKHYNLDVIISVGYRVKSLRGTQFRIWATQRLKEYIIKGFALDDERLKQGVKSSRYFEELLERIRDIRSSERNFYQKVTDIYSTSVDYNKNEQITRDFFASVQNKMHYAVHGQTAAEVIYNRVDAKKPQIGLTSLKGAYLTSSDIEIAKNYLSETELKQLNLIVSLFLDFAELQATNRMPMKMLDWITKLDDFLKLANKKILKNKGSISREQAKTKAQKELRRFKEAESKRFISDFDKLVEELKTSTAG